MNLFPDPKILVLQAIPFLLTLVVLKYVILDPLLQYLIERRDRTLGASGKLSELANEVQEAEATYQQRLGQLRKEAADIRAAALEKAGKEEQVILAAAQTRANAELAAFRLSLEEVVVSARAQLTADANPLASQVASTILGRPVEGAPQGGTQS